MAAQTAIVAGCAEGARSIHHIKFRAGGLDIFFRNRAQEGPFPTSSTLRRFYVPVTVHSGVYWFVVNASF